MAKVEHTTIRNNSLFCLNCGSAHLLNMPVGIKDLNKKIKAFNILHKDCEKTWVELEADQKQSMKERALWWIVNGHVGLSSKTMWNYFMGYKDFEVNHPHDPDDFSRCQKLLEAIPEWKKRVPELSILSKEWKALSSNWEKLTEMYEKNKNNNWTNSEEIGMFDFMQTLLD